MDGLERGRSGRNDEAVCRGVRERHGRGAVNGDGPLLVAGETCAALVPTTRTGLLIDGRDFYRALFDAIGRAQRSVVMAGWQFDTRVELVRGEDACDASRPCELLGCLVAACKARPELEVHILGWEASAVFAFEREPLQRFFFHQRGHERIHFEMDNCHPPGASQHQKLIVVDRGVAFVGGMDVCGSRWDDRAHRAVEPARQHRGRAYPPYHDVQCFVSGGAVDHLRDWFGQRWRAATGRALPERELPADPIDVRSTMDVRAPRVGLSHTWPEVEGCPLPQVRQLRELHLRAIARAERLLYVESQYFSCDEVARALVARMERDAPRLEIVIVLPQRSAGFKERVSVGVYQARILRTLVDAARRNGHRLGVYYPAAPGPDGDVPVFIHAKVLIVDDRVLLVSSANLTNRSMSYDSELGVAWEAPVAEPSIVEVRRSLLGEHCGLDDGEARALDPVGGLVDRLDRLARSGEGRLRLHGLNQDERPGPLLAWFVPDDPPFDPDHIEDVLPEPALALDRLLRDPAVLVRASARNVGRRLARARRSPGQDPT